MSKKNLDQWFDALEEDQKEPLLLLRSLILGAGDGIREELKWGQPCYSGAHLFCYLQKARAHVTLGFQQGAHLNDPKGLLQGSGKDMRHLRFSSVNEIDRETCHRLIAEAIRFDAARGG